MAGAPGGENRLAAKMSEGSRASDFGKRMLEGAGGTTTPGVAAPGSVNCQFALLPTVALHLPSEVPVVGWGYMRSMVVA